MLGERISSAPSLLISTYTGMNREEIRTTSKRTIKRKFTFLFIGKYQKYFIWCVEDIKIFMNFMFSTHLMKYFWCSPKKNVNILTLSIFFFQNTGSHAEFCCSKQVYRIGLCTVIQCTRLKRSSRHNFFLFFFIKAYIAFY